MAQDEVEEVQKSSTKQVAQASSNLRLITSAPATLFWCSLLAASSVFSDVLRGVDINADVHGLGGGQWAGLMTEHTASAFVNGVM